MSRWDGIEEFVAVVETGSFSAAATRLGVSSSHISRQVARVEDRLQARLFNRTTRRVSLTEAGQTFYRHCQQLIEARDEAFLAIHDLQGEPKGLLRMTCAVTYGEMYIVPLVNEFVSRYPGLQVDIQLSNRTIDIVQEGFDLAIRLGRLTESRLVATRIAPRVMYLCAAPGYLERYGTPHSLSELGRHNCLIGNSDTWIFQVDGQEYLFKARGNWRCNSGRALLDATLRGFGLSQLPDYYVQEYLRTGELRSLLEAHQPPHTAVWAVYAARRHLSPKVRLLVDFLKVELAKLPIYQQASA